MANAQTKATKKYQESKGIIRKTFIVRKETVEAFKEACDKSGITQAAALEKLMQDFICKQASD